MQVETQGASRALAVESSLSIAIGQENSRALGAKSGLSQALAQTTSTLVFTQAALGQAQASLAAIAVCTSQGLLTQSNGTCVSANGTSSLSSIYLCERCGV